MKFFGPKDIKFFVKKYLNDNKELFKNKIIIDIPTGTGTSSEILTGLGALVEPYDLFPEFFKVDGLKCNKADALKKLPIDNNHANFVLCQEGMEHFENQLFVLKEFNRILKKNGILILTTPNYSKLKSRISYLLAESESFFKIMPPNELDSIWVNNSNGSKDIYFGHIFLIGIQKLRMLAKLAGFRIKKINPVRINRTSLYLLPFIYPFIFIVNHLSYFRALKKKERNPCQRKEKSVPRVDKIKSRLKNFDQFTPVY
ncbi:MAG: methyltransferase domain-containing protein [Bacteroidota bacterium]